VFREFSGSGLIGWIHVRPLVRETRDGPRILTRLEDLSGGFTKRGRIDYRPNWISAHWVSHDNNAVALTICGKTSDWLILMAIPASRPTRANPRSRVKSGEHSHALLTLPPDFNWLATMGADGKNGSREIARRWRFHRER